MSFPVNPFITRRVRPGAVPYFFPAGGSADTLLDRLAADRWRGQVVGPHGTGKSTLLACLLAALTARGVAFRHVELHDGRREVPAGTWAAPGLLVVDGFEQLWFWQRRRLRQRAGGLLATAHRGMGLPTLWRTGVTEATAGQVLAYLLEGRQRLVDEADLRHRLKERGGNLREALFDLYDLHESRRPRASAVSPQ